jgi:hypothetical protein
MSPDDAANPGRGRFVVEATALVAASPTQVLDFVLDLDRYRQADHKIRKVRHSERQGDEVVVAMWARFAGLPVAATQRMRLTPGVRIDVTNEPSWQDRFTDFRGEFVCVVVPGGTEVTHRYTFTFRGVARPMAALLRGWFQRDITAEVARLKDILDSSGDTTDPT